MFLKKITKQIATEEDWYPTLGGQVKVSLLRLSNGQWRVCVWGGDDFGLEQDFPAEALKEAKALYDRLNDETTQSQMRALGMWNA